MKKGIFLTVIVLAAAFLLDGLCGMPETAAAEPTDEVQRALATPLDDWADKDSAAADGSEIFRQHTLGDIFNSDRFNGAKWLVNPSMTTDHDWLLVYYGYVSGGKEKDMLVMLQVLCDTGKDGCVPDYIGLISADEKTRSEAWVDKDGLSGFSQVLAELCGYLELT